MSSASSPSPLSPQLLTLETKQRLASHIRCVKSERYILFRYRRPQSSQPEPLQLQQDEFESALSSQTEHAELVLCHVLGCQDRCDDILQDSYDYWCDEFCDPNRRWWAKVTKTGLLNVPRHTWETRGGRG